MTTFLFTSGQGLIARYSCGSHLFSTTCSPTLTQKSLIVGAAVPLFIVSSYLQRSVIFPLTAVFE